MDNGKFIVCRASAGSGKTFTLVKTFLKLAFDVKAGKDWERTRQLLCDRYKHILAITFTNKAVNEMKTRIMSELAKMATDVEHSDMAKAIMDDWAKEKFHTTLETLQKYAEVVRGAILHDYSDLSVCTIDKFMHRVVRTFAHDLGLPLNFDVTQKQDDVIVQVVGEMMSAIGEEGEEELTDMLVAYCENQMEDDRTVNIEHAISELSNELFKEDVPQYLNNLSELTTAQFKELATKLKEKNKEWSQQIQKEASDILNECSADGLEGQDFAGGKNGIYGFLEKIANGDITKELSKTAQKFIDENDVVGSSKCPKDNVAQIEALKGSIRSVVEHQQNGLQIYNSRKALLNNLYGVSLLNRLKATTQQYYRENEVLHLSEFNQRIADVVKDEPAPFIYERLGTHYWNYLIDEFQDTSILQWQNLLPLVDNGVSTGHSSLIVGDGKQAIYRFRQGDAKQFADLPKVKDNEHGHGMIFEETYQKDNLDTNYRSLRNIIDFNNNLFYWIVKNRFTDNEDLQIIYLDEHNSKEESSLWQKSRKEGGYVKVAFFPKEDFEDQIHENLYKTIQEQIEKGYRYRDICILSRKNSTLSAIGQYLSGMKINDATIPLVSSESFLLNNSRVVTLLLSLLRYLADNKDGVAAAQVLVLLNQMGRLQKDCTEIFAVHNAIPLERLLHEEGIPIDCVRLSAMPIYDCCEEAIRCLGIDGIEPDYTASFLNLVADFGENHPQDFTQFLEWYDNLNGEGKLSAKTSDDLDAIRLMTIHKAKGLESPIILYPIFPESRKPIQKWVPLDDKEQKLLNAEGLRTALISLNQSDSTVFNSLRDEENRNVDMDNLNVLYVALTRPREKLFVYAPEPKSDDKKDVQKDYASLLYDFQCCGGWDELVASETGNSYHIGEDTPKAESSEKEYPSEQIVTISRISHHTDKIIIAPTSLKSEEQRQRGILIHDTLSKIKDTNDLDAAVADSQQRYNLTEEETSTLRADIQQVISDPVCAKFFTPGNEVKNECDIAYHDKVCRPDRIVFTPTETYVIDFKTGSRNLKHHEQVAGYCNIIQEMGYPNVSGYILYISETGNDVVSVC